MLQLPEPLAVAVPFDVPPSKTSTVLLASAFPERVTSPVLLRLLSAGLVIVGLSGGTVSTVHVRVASLGSSLSLGSVARTSKVYVPEVRPFCVCVPVPEQAPNAGFVRFERYMRHLKVESGSLESNAKVAEVFDVTDPFCGPSWIVVSGNTSSTWLRASVKVPAGAPQQPSTPIW